MNKPANGLRISTLTAIMAILLIPIMQGTQTFAEEKKSTSVNDVGITAVFHFRVGDETVKTFEVFTQNKGYIRGSETPTFTLQGIVGGDKEMLYQATDVTYFLGGNQNHEYNEFNVDVYLHNGEKSYRQFSYDDCRIKNYTIETITDKGKEYNRSSKFAIVDNFEFQCIGLQLKNPMYQKMLDDKKAEEKAAMKSSQTAIKSSKK